MTVRDIREVPDANVDLLIAVHNAVLVVAPDSGIRTTVLNVRDEQDRQSSMSVGICPVGDKFREAEVIVRGWIAKATVCIVLRQWRCGRCGTQGNTR